MSFKANAFRQITLNDSFLNASDRVKKIVEHSWCKDFADVVFPAINEERFAVLYSDNKFSRSNTPVNFIVGALFLKENNSLSDDELMEAICCDIRYQYALHTTHLKEQPVSDRTFSRFRERLYNYALQTGKDLMAEEMEHLTSNFKKYMSLNSNVKRMDSMMVASRCKKMSRLEIVYATTANAVRLFDRCGETWRLNGSLMHYLEEDDLNNTVYYCKGEDVEPRLAKALKEAEAVLAIMSDDRWHEFQEYQLLFRVLNEQTEQSGDGSRTARDKGDIAPDSLQNPSDPDATFRKKAGKAHKGYSTNIVEEVGETGSLITGIQTEKNNYSDSQFFKDYAEGKTSDDKETVITDGAFGGAENQAIAESKNIELVTTSLTGRETDKLLADFVFNEEGTQVRSCPAGHAPIKTTYYPKTGQCRVLFKKNCCAECPNRDICKAKEQRKNFAVHISANMVRRAGYLKKLSTDEYKKLTRQRNAVEGIPSVFRRKYRVDEIPVFGLLRVRPFIIFKALAYDFNKIRNYNRRSRDKSALLPAIG